MDGDRFDSLTRALGSGRSRRSLVKSLGAAALGVVGLGRLGSAEAASNNNSACAHFCNQVFGADTTAAGQCTSQGAHGTGPCVTCANNPANYCNGTCDHSSDVNNCGSCGIVCGGSTDCLAPVCTNGVCGTVPTNETGSCDNGTGTCQGGTCVPTCAGTVIHDVCAATCASGGTCSGFPACAPGVGNGCSCSSLAEGGGDCTAGAACPGAGGTACTATTDCPPGYACSVNTCCGAGGACEPLCALAGSATLAAAAILTGPTTKGAA